LQQRSNDVRRQLRQCLQSTLSNGSLTGRVDRDPDQCVEGIGPWLRSHRAAQDADRCDGDVRRVVAARIRRDVPRAWIFASFEGPQRRTPCIGRRIRGDQRRESFVGTAPQETKPRHSGFAPCRPTFTQLRDQVLDITRR
jgi:hypothetical protein